MQAANVTPPTPTARDASSVSWACSHFIYTSNVLVQLPETQSVSAPNLLPTRVIVACTILDRNVLQHNTAQFEVALLTGNELLCSPAQIGNATSRKEVNNSATINNIPTATKQLNTNHPLGHSLHKAYFGNQKNERITKIRTEIACAAAPHPSRRGRFSKTSTPSHFSARLQGSSISKKPDCQWRPASHIQHP